MTTGVVVQDHKWALWVSSAMQHLLNSATQSRSIFAKIKPYIQAQATLYFAY